MISSAKGGDANETQLSILEEHRILAQRIDDASTQVDIFFSAADNKNADELRRIVVLIEELLEIARKHFQHEESEMAMNAFPGLRFHKRDHDYLIKSLLNFTTALSHETIPPSNDIGVNLRSWLTYHIKKYDDAYAKFLSSDNAN